MNLENIRRISFFWSWIGGPFSTPTHRVIHLVNARDHFLRRDLEGTASVPIDANLVAEFLRAVQEPIIAAFELDRMGLTADWVINRAPALIEDRCRELPALQADPLAREGLGLLMERPDLETVLREKADSDFNSCWTNDYPHLRIKLLAEDDHVVLIQSASQHAFMLPWGITDVGEGTRVETFNSSLSRTAAKLLPEDFPGQFKLRGDGLVNQLLWDILGDRMQTPSEPVEEREIPSFIPTSQPLERTLLEAAHGGDLPGIEELLAAGVSLECRDEEGQTPLMLAVLGGHLDVVSALLDAGADVEGRDNEGDTPLLNALAESGFMRALRSMMPNQEKQDSRQHSALVRLLLNAGADPNGANSKYGTTPLLKATKIKEEEALSAARLLIEKGANTNVADGVGQTALMHAAFPPFDHEMFQLLVGAGADPNTKRNDGSAGLLMAAAGWETAAARAWIAAGADVNAPGPNGNTPLMLAAQGSPDIVDALLNAGADMNAADDDGDTALHFAVVGKPWSGEDDKLPIVKRLLEAGANVQARNRKGNSALTELLCVESEQRIKNEVHHEFRSESQGCEPDATAVVPGESRLYQYLREAGCEP